MTAQAALNSCLQSLSGIWQLFKSLTTFTPQSVFVSHHHFDLVVELLFVSYCFWNAFLRPHCSFRSLNLVTGAHNSLCKQLDRYSDG